MRDESHRKHGDRGSRLSLIFGRATCLAWIFLAFLGSTLWTGRGVCQEGTPFLEPLMPAPTASVSAPVHARLSSACDASKNLYEILRKTDAELGDSQIRFPYSFENRKDGKTESSLAPYLFAREKDPETDPLLLKRMEGEVQIVGPIARVKLYQVFQNIGARVIDADYVFPASAKTDVHGVRVRIGEQIIPAQIERRDQADVLYEQPEFKDKRVSLIRQVWPNLFLMNVPHIEPGDSIQVELDYSQPMIPQNAVYEFTLPAISGPRRKGEPDSLRNPWIPNPSFIEGEAVPFDFDIAVELRTGIPIKTVFSPSHNVSVFYKSRDSVQVHLDHENGGNKDFVLQYKLAGDHIESSALMYQGLEENYIAVLLEPPERPSNFRIPLREFIFVVDVSESMKGFPLDTAKVLIERLLLDLRASDFLNVVLFGGDSMVLNSHGSVNATEENIREAISLLDRPSGDSGAQLMGALLAAYGIPRAPGHISRSLVVITDGYVGVEAQVFKFVREHLDEANLFVFGIGVSVNRALIEGMARAGQAKPFVVIRPDRAATQAEAFRTYIKNPVLSEVAVTFEGLDVYDRIPLKLPDLIAQRPLVVIGKYRGAPAGRIRISGFTGEERYVESLEASPFVVAEENAPIGELWARKWLELLEDQYAFLPHENVLRETVIHLSLCHNLPTPFTGFVTVDSRMEDVDGSIRTVTQTLGRPRSLPQSTPESSIRDSHPSSNTDKPMAPEVEAIVGNLRQEVQQTSVPPIPSDAEKATDEPAKETDTTTKVVFLFTPSNLKNPMALKKALRDKIRPAAEQCTSSPATLTFRIEVDEYGRVIGVTIVETSGDRDMDACIIKGLPGIVTESRPFGTDYGSLQVTLNILVE